MKQREESYEKANAARVRVEIWAHLGYLCQEGPTQGGRRLLKSFPEYLLPYQCFLIRFIL